MSSKRKTPARTKTTKAQGPVASAAPAAARTESAVSAPAHGAVSASVPAQMASPAAAPAAERARAGAPAISPTPPRMSREERHRQIAKVAYGHAERAGFRNNPVDDWLRAEREVDARLERLAS